MHGGFFVYFDCRYLLAGLDRKLLCFDYLLFRISFVLIFDWMISLIGAVYMMVVIHYYQVLFGLLHAQVCPRIY